MRIIINGRFFLQKITGVQRYAREIVAEMDNLASFEDDIRIIIPNVDMDTDIPKFKNIKIIKYGKIKSQIWDYLCFTSYVKRNKGIAINLCNVAIFTYPSIVCLHDITHKVNPQFHKSLKEKIKSLWHRINSYLIAKSNSTIITVSDFSKKEIVKYYNVSPDRIYIIGSAWQHMDKIKSDEKNFDKYNMLTSGEYYFTMANAAVNKNFKWVVSAALHSPESVFVVAGGGNFRESLKNIDVDSIKNLFFLGYVSDEDAKVLMKNCRAFIFPTFYEGFGLPALEAIACGSPHIIVSDTPCMHEIYGKYANYIDPYNYNIDIKNIVLDSTINARDILKQYSWEKSAKNLLEIIKKGITF